MKKLAFLLTAIIVFALNSNVFGQSTGTNPVAGATHTYEVTTPNAGSNYNWWVTTDDLSTIATGASLSASTGTGIEITWASTGLTVDDWYYVWVKETDTNGCTNKKVLAVQIAANPFYLAISAAATSCYDDSVSVSLSSNQPVYDHGTATLTYTITPTGVNASSDGYSFNYSNTAVGGYTWATPTVASGSATASGDVDLSTAGTAIVTGTSAVTLEFVITNGNTYTNSTDADGDAADFTSTISISAGETGNGVSDNGTGAKSAGTAVSRPHTTVISTN